MLYISYGVTDDCKNLEESYGEICVRCNKCGRFDKDKAESEVKNEKDGISRTRVKGEQS